MRLTSSALGEVWPIRPANGKDMSPQKRPAAPDGDAACEPAGPPSAPQCDRQDALALRQTIESNARHARIAAIRVFFIRLFS